MRSPREKCIMQTRTNISFTSAAKNSIVSTRFSQSGEQQEKTCLAEMLVFMSTLQCKNSESGGSWYPKQLGDKGWVGAVTLATDCSEHIRALLTVGAAWTTSVLLLPLSPDSVINWGLQSNIFSVPGTLMGLQILCNPSLWQLCLANLWSVTRAMQQKNFSGTLQKLLGEKDVEWMEDSVEHWTDSAPEWFSAFILWKWESLLVRKAGWVKKGSFCDVPCPPSPFALAG